MRSLIPHPASSERPRPPHRPSLPARARSWIRFIRIIPALLLATCSDVAEQPPYSALLITLDTTRFDALSCNGAAPGVTPNLDRLASEGVLYERAYTVAPLTLPSHASMLTGLYPPRHSVRSNGHGRLPDAATTLAEAAKRAGLQTAAFVSAVVLSDAFGLAQGFDRYDSPQHDADRTASFYSERSSSDTVRRARAWLSTRDRGRRFFLWVHLWEPHAPLAPPAEFRGTTPSPYLDEVAAMDDAAGDLIESLREDGELDRTVVLVVGDHGEAFGEHGEISHGTYCYDTTLRVPMILRHPDTQLRGKRSQAIASVVDVAPTLAEALGVRLDRGIDGTSIHVSESGGTKRGVYFESYYGYLNYDWSPIAGWVDAGGKYVHSSNQEFFDVHADPREERNLCSERAGELERYRTAIGEVAARPSLAANGAGVDEELRAALQELGYAGVEPPAGALPHPLAPSTRPSPMARIAENGQIIQALALVNEGKFGEAESIYAGILAENPRNFEALDHIAFCQLRQLRYDEAIASFRRALDAGRATANSIAYFGVCMRATGRLDEAIELYSRALRTDPNETEALWQMIDVLEYLDRSDEADVYRARLDRLTQVDEPD